MHYGRFAAMILASTVVMFGLMYLNTYALEHIFFSETRIYMALLMGGVMAVVMMAFMFGMYPSRRVNLGIMIGGGVVFVGTLFLVRAQVTVQDASYMRAMIPHHSIAVMTSTRAEISDPRVTGLAGDIALAQRKEIAEMRALIADLEAGRTSGDVYEDPAPQVGDVQAALSNTLLSTLDPEPLTREEAGQVLAQEAECTFRYTRAGDPVLYATSPEGPGVMLLNGVLVPLDATSPGLWSAEGLGMFVEELPGAGLRANARLTFRLSSGPEAAFLGFWHC
ncbi:DUF305 domain-containing protein [Sagittula salina]|uniref:DUF305 domain-containing protein n=1 Tax=Sagittula salina TaxID=2820268 RepID=A0A940MPX2_9RHOB|nr:DUF305 domain-containing protein [Sagittula salina]MBP0483673.1 DUF305 domain-containing protein [Sagittula salina]